MYVFLCPWYSNPLLWPWHNLCYSIFLEKYPAPLPPAKCMLLYVPAIVSHSFNPGSMCVILCSWHSLLPLQPQQNVCYSRTLKKYPAPLNPAKCMLFYVPDLVSCPFDPRTMCVILCSWFSLLPLQHRHYVCPLQPQQQCMLFYFPDIVSRPFDPGTMPVFLCS